MPMFPKRAVVTTPPPLFAVAPLTPGEVEVLTVDVRMANKVRCANQSIAEDVAKFLKIPVKRITVTPWSWTLPDPPQSNYLAFLQEDHDRCGCETESGNVVEGAGFQKASGATDGWAVDADTKVMTVSQFRAMHGQADPNSPAAHAPGAPGAPTTTTTTLPASRVQMLTRDPCLVHMLREMTPKFKKKIAFFLGVPEDKVIVDPPPVAGTIGLLQLESRLNSEEETKQMPVLGVRQCTLSNKLELAEKLSLLDVDEAGPAPAPATFWAPSPASFPIFSVASPNNTNGTNMTNATNVSQQRVSLVMKFHNMDYDLLAASWPLVSSFSHIVKAAIGEAGHVPATAVKMALFPGSVVLEATIDAPPGTSPDAVLAFLNGTVCNDTMNRLGTMTSLQSTLNGDLSCSVLSLTLEDPPFAPQEENRAWIALWSVTILPPFAKDGAWRLLQMVNKPMTELSKLLPFTLARIPGLRYRGLREPNAALHETNETRLPPPEDKAVGFALPDPYPEEAEMKFEMARMKRENAARTLMVNDKSALDNMRAKAALEASKVQQKMLSQADIKFTRAARAHASAMRAPNATTGPDIVPFEVLVDPMLKSESPYPWRDQDPPPRYMLSLEQEGSKKKSLRQRSTRKPIA